jgi:succinate dehydrogenase/fumarate reductase cytochrome b subunit
MKKINPKFDKVFFLMFSGCIMGFASFLTLLYVFINAYFSDAKTTVSYIDKFGEADIEMFMMIVLFGFFIICLIYGFKRIFSKENK